MTLNPQTTVAEIAAAAPATIAVFQRHHIDFCCGGKVPLEQACRTHGLDVESVLSDLRAAVVPAGAEPSWADATLTALIAHIQQRYHAYLRLELARLGAMLEKVASRHGDRLPETLPPLQQTFETLQRELLEHMATEDQVLFPNIAALESGAPLPSEDVDACLAAPMATLEAEHRDARDALARIRDITGGFAPPEWACPTFRGLYYGLAQLETDMHVHVHLETNVLFPRAAQLARRYRRPQP